jgi:hypothetical protein
MAPWYMATMSPAYSRPEQPEIDPGLFDVAHLVHEEFDDHLDPGAQPEIDPGLFDVAHIVHEEFDDHLDPGAIDECLAKVAARFHGATVHSFVPLLVRRYVREELQTRLREA